jgi:hypothetical protein
MNEQITLTRRVGRTLVLAGFIAAAGAVQADEGHAYNLANDKFRSECGSCHIPYPPALLPAGAWQQIMASLDKHFGSDASLDAKTALEIGNFLAQNAGRHRGRSSPGSTPRISDSRWFLSEHNEDLSPAVWKNPKVKSAANCGACHTRAESGDYGESSLRVPR